MVLIDGKLHDKQRKRIGDRYILKLYDYIRLSVRMAKIYFSIRMNLWSGTGERAEAWECHVWAVKVERGSWRDTTHGQTWAGHAEIAASSTSLGWQNLY